MLRRQKSQSPGKERRYKHTLSRKGKALAAPSLGYSRQCLWVSKKTDKQEEEGEGEEGEGGEEEEKNVKKNINTHEEKKYPTKRP